MSPHDEKEVFHCMDEGQGFDHKCVEFFDGMCSRETKCRFQLSPLLAERFKNDIKEAEKRIRQEIKNEIRDKIEATLTFITSEGESNDLL